MSVILSYEFLPLFNMKKQMESQKYGGEEI